MIDESIVSHLRSHGIKVSGQRAIIYSYLCDRKNHPTVDIIYNDLRSKYPMLSKTTIYNTLKLFAEKNLISRLIVEDGELRFDANTMFHAHFRCSKCGMIYDIMTQNEQLSINLPKNFIITETHLNYRGICNKCEN